MQYHNITATKKSGAPHISTAGHVLNIIVITCKKDRTHLFRDRSYLVVPIITDYLV